MFARHHLPNFGEPGPESRGTRSEFDAKNELTLGATSIGGYMSAPIHRLPPEDLSRIFDMCLKSQSWRRPLRNGPPCLFLQVCKEWRRVALLTPSLWSEIELWLDKDPNSNARKALALETWFTRSRQLPLTISVCCLWKDENTPGCHPIISIIVSRAHRWKRLILTHVSEELLMPLLKLDHGSTPLLEYLRLSDGCSILDDLRFYKTSPMLDELWLQGQLGPTIGHFPSSSLTYLSLAWEKYEIVPISNFIQILENMPRLTFFRASLPRLEPDGLIISPICIPALEELEFECEKQDGENKGALELFFSRLNLPSLNYLDLNSNLPLDEQDVEAFLSMVLRSRCQMKRMCWPRLDRSNERLLIRLFFALSSLEHLSTDGCGLTKRIMEHLTYLPESPTVCLLPKLEELHLWFEGTESNTYHTDMQLARMIHSRWRYGVDVPTTENAVSCLRYVELRLEGRQIFDWQAQRHLDKCRREGLHLDFVMKQQMESGNASGPMQVDQNLVGNAAENEEMNVSSEDVRPSSHCKADLVQMKTAPPQYLSSPAFINYVKTLQVLCVRPITPGYELIARLPAPGPVYLARFMGYEEPVVMRLYLSLDEILHVNMTSQLPPGFTWDDFHYVVRSMNTLENLDSWMRNRPANLAKYQGDDPRQQTAQGILGSFNRSYAPPEVLGPFSTAEAGYFQDGPAHVDSNSVPWSTADTGYFQDDPAHVDSNLRPNSTAIPGAFQAYPAHVETDSEALCAVDADYFQDGPEPYSMADTGYLAHNHWPYSMGSTGHFQDAPAGDGYNLWPPTEDDIKTTSERSVLKE